MSSINASSIITSQLSSNALIVGNSTVNTTYSISSYENLIPSNESSLSTSNFVTYAATSAVNDPFGGTNSYLCIENTEASNTVHTIYRTSNGFMIPYSNVPLYWSAYLKKRERNKFYLSVENNPSFTDGAAAVFNVDTGQIIDWSFGSKVSLLDCGMDLISNGWYKCWIIGLVNFAYPTDNVQFHIRPVNDSLQTSYPGDGTSGFYLYGPQLSVSKVKDTYIRTSGATISRSFNFGSNLQCNSIAISVGNSTVNTYLTTGSITTNSITVNGTNYTTASSPTVLSHNTFTSTGWSSWTKPADISSNDTVTIMLWGGGGGGNTTAAGGGGGGGACVIVNLKASQVNATCNVFVASGGSSGVAGENSVFWPNSTYSITAYGGGGSSTGALGGGGGWFSAGSGNGTGGGPLGGANGSGLAWSLFGGGGANTTSAGVSVYGGGGGGYTVHGGNSIFGGGGGTWSAVGGLSDYGGHGGNNTVAATAPGGGGGGNTAAYGAGARGEVRVWVTRVTG